MTSSVTVKHLFWISTSTIVLFAWISLEYAVWQSGVYSGCLVIIWISWYFSLWLNMYVQWKEVYSLHTATNLWKFFFLNMCLYSIHKITKTGFLCSLFNIWKFHLKSDEEFVNMFTMFRTLEEGDNPPSPSSPFLNCLWPKLDITNSWFQRSGLLDSQMVKLSVSSARGHSSKNCRVEPVTFKVALVWLHTVPGVKCSVVIAWIGWSGVTQSAWDSRVDLQSLSQWGVQLAKQICPWDTLCLLGC